MSLSLSWRYLILTWIIGLCFAAVTSFSYYMANRSYYLAGIDAKLMTGAVMARHFVGADFHDRLVDAQSLDAEAYLAIVARNNAACLETGFQYLWSNLFLPDGRIVFTTAASPDKEAGRGGHADFFSPHTDPAAFDTVRGSEQPTFSTFRNEWGQGRMVLLPYRDAQGRLYVFGASMALQPIEDYMIEQLRWTLGLFTLLFLGATLAALLLSRSMTLPLRQLLRTTEAVARGDYSTPEAFGGGEEIEALSVSLNQMRDAIADAMAKLQESEARFHAIFDQSPLSIMIHDRDNAAVIDANPAAWKAYGLDSLAALKAYDIWLEAPYSQADALDWIKQDGQSDQVREWQSRKVTGEVFWELVCLRPILIDSTERIVLMAVDITERKRLDVRLTQARMDLESERTFLKTLLRTIPSLVWLKDRDGVFLACNTEFERLYGHPEAEIVGKRDSDFVSPELADFFRGHDRAAIAAGKPTVNKEWVAYAGDGRRAFLNTVKTPMFASDGSLVGVLGIGYDITEAHTLSESLKRQNERHLALLRNASDGIHILDRDGTVIEASDSFCAMLGYDREEIIGMNVRQWDVAHDAEQRAHRIAEQFSNPGRSQFESKHRRKNGTVFDVEISGSVIALDGHQVLFNSSRDISERKAASAALRQLNDELEQRVRQNTQELQATFAQLRDTNLAMNSVGFGIYWVEFGTGRFLYVNQFAADLLGYTCDEMLELSVSDIDPHFPPAALKEINEQLLEAGFLKFESEQAGRDGRRVPVEMTLYYHAGMNGASARVIAFMQNIAERKRAEQELREAKANAEAAALAKSAFLANMSHEIRTPLNGILGLARIGQRDNAGSPVGELCARILQSGRHLQGLIDDILDISKLEAGKMTIAPIPMNLQTTLQEVLALVAEPAAEKLLSLTFVAAPDLPVWVMGDALRLRQILVNLLSNAIKFTERGSVTLTVERAGERIAFAVTDTGIGLTEEQRARLFQAFEQADAGTTRKFGGTGLGLAISQNLAHLMGGEITAECALGEGCVFTLRLPLPPTDAPSTTGLNGALKPGQRLQGLRILAAEDMEINRFVLGDLLAEEGAEHTLVGNGAEAVAAVRRNPDGYDLVLMDVQMPIMDGREATRQIKRLAPSLPVIALTAHALASERQLSIEAGMTAYLTKPIDPNALVNAVLACLPAPLPLVEPSPAPEPPAADIALPDTPELNAVDLSFSDPF